MPADYDPLRGLAQSVVRAAGAKTPFQEAVALQNWLAAGPFKYDLNAPTVLTAAGLTNFLETKKGYCQQFSYAMAVLARLLGIPSRIAYGFTAGAPNGTGTFRVTTHDAHAWPELFFQGYGWLRFEPTPSGLAGQGTAYAPSYSAAPGGVTGPPGLAPGPIGSPGATATGRASIQGLPPNIQQLLGNEGLGGTSAVAGRGTLSPWEIVGLVAAGLVVLALTAPWCARLIVRRRRWRRGRRWPAARPAVIGADGTAGTSGATGTSGTGGAIGTALAVRPERAALSGLSAREARVRARDIAWAHAAWLELRDDLMDYGAGYLPSESPRAVATRAGDGLVLTGTAREALGRIAMAEERARYAPAPADGSGLRADSVAVRRAIAAAVPRGTRWRARLLPSSVLGPVLATVASAANPYRGRIGAEGSHRLGLTGSAGSGRGAPLEPALLPPAPALVKPLTERGMTRGSPLCALGAAALARPLARRGAQGDGGHLPPAIKHPDAAQQHDDESRDGQADDRQDDAGGDHGRAKRQADKRLCHPAPVMHAGIARANKPR